MWEIGYQLCNLALQTAAKHIACEVLSVEKVKSKGILQKIPGDPAIGVGLKLDDGVEL